MAHQSRAIFISKRNGLTPNPIHTGENKGMKGKTPVKKSKKTHSSHYFLQNSGAPTRGYFHFLAREGVKGEMGGPFCNPLAYHDGDCPTNKFTMMEIASFLGAITIQRGTARILRRYQKGDLLLPPSYPFFILSPSESDADMQFLVQVTICLKILCICGYQCIIIGWTIV